MQKTAEKPEKNEIKPRRNILLSIFTNKILFTLHLFLYVAVMALLTVIWLVTLPLDLGVRLVYWPIFPMLGWGIGIGFHALTYLMYNDKIEYLTKVRKQSAFGVLFVYHALIYGLVNLIIISANLIAEPSVPAFLWPLGMWGIAFGIHALGFFTFDMNLKREINFFVKRYSQYEEKKHQMMARTKILNFWLLMANIAYFIVGNILLYVNFPETMIIDGTLAWGTFLGVHAFAYIFYYYATTVKAAFRGLIIHLVFFGAAIGWALYQLISSGVRISPLIIAEPIMLWGILIATHTFVAIKWDPILSNATAIIERQVGDSLDKYDIHSRARWLAFWKWSFIAHIGIYAATLIITGIQISIESLDPMIMLHVAFGEAIGLSIHGAIYYILLKNIRQFWRWTFFIHLVVYIVVGLYLVVGNIVLAPGIAWSAIALAGWGIGLGVHFLIAKFAGEYKIAEK